MPEILHDIRIYDDLVTAALAANVSEDNISVTIDQDYGGFIEYISGIPALAAGVSNSSYVELALNGQNINNLSWKFNAINRNMLRPALSSSFQKPISFGLPPAPGKEYSPLANLCIPINESDLIAVRHWANATGITATVNRWFDMKIHLLNDAALVSALGGRQVNFDLDYIKVHDQRSITQSKTISQIDVSRVRELPAGDKQSAPTLEHYIKFQENQAATTANQDFSMRLDANPKQNMYWQLKGKEILVLEKLGVTPDINNYLKFIFVEIQNVKYPQNFWRIDRQNMLPLGDPSDAQGPNDIEPDSVPYKNSGPKTITMYARDSGTSIATANPFLVGLWGKFIQLR